jgi:hypothetical protein
MEEVEGVKLSGYSLEATTMPMTPVLPMRILNSNGEYTHLTKPHGTFEIEFEVQ